MLQKSIYRQFASFVNVVNPFTWDKLSEINVDPEVMNMFQYPVMKSYNLGLSVQF